MTTYAEALHALADELRALADRPALEVVQRGAELGDPRHEDSLSRRMSQVRRLAAQAAVDGAASQFAVARQLGIGEQTLSRLLSGHRKSRAKDTTTA